MRLDGAVTTDLISRARAGDGEAFRELTDSYRRELQVHCYRMLGSFQDAEDALQDTLLTAWRGLEGSRDDPRSAPGSTGSPPTGASTRCARPADARPRSGTSPSMNRRSRPGSARSSGSSRSPTPCWGCDRRAARPRGPLRADRSDLLAFVTALQVLPPRQVAVLILRDVLGFHADEVADMLDSTVESVTSALKRARANLQRLPPAAERNRLPLPTHPPSRRSWRSSSAPGSPPMSVRWWRFDGRRLRLDAACALRIRGPRRRGPLLRQRLGSGRSSTVPTRANGQPAFGHRAPRPATAAAPASTSSASRATDPLP